MHACGREVSLQRWTRLGRLWFGSSYVRSMRVAACRHLAPLAGAATKKTERRNEDSVQTTSLVHREGVARTDLFAKAQKRPRIIIQSTATSERAFATRRPCPPRPLAQQFCGGCETFTDKRLSDAIGQKRAAAYVINSLPLIPCANSGAKRESAAERPSRQTTFLRPIEGPLPTALAVQLVQRLREQNPKSDAGASVAGRTSGSSRNHGRRHGDQQRQGMVNVTISVSSRACV